MRRHGRWILLLASFSLIAAACTAGNDDTNVQVPTDTVNIGESRTVTSDTETDVATLADNAAGSGLIKELTDGGFTEEEATCLATNTFDTYNDAQIAEMVTSGNLPPEIDQKVSESMDVCVTTERQSELVPSPLDTIREAYVGQGFTVEEIDCIFTGLEDAHGGQTGLENIIINDAEDEAFYLGLETITLNCLTVERQQELSITLGG